MAEAAVLTPLGWLVSPLIKMLFDKAHNHLGTGVDERRKILAATVLPSLSLAIEKAEKSPNKEKLVDWLNRLKGAYYKAEEAIDLFEYELLKQKVNDDRKILEQKTKNERGTRFSFPSQFVPRRLKNVLVKLKYGLSVFSRQKIMLKGCIDKLIEIAKEANNFRDLLEVQENASGSNADRETISEPPGRVFGREIDKKNIVGLLMKKPLNSEPGPSTKPAIPIITITGRSGVGKTALAQHVYKYMDGQAHFDLLVWVHAPRKFEATNVIKNMIEIIKAKKGASNDYPSTSLEALLTQIRSMLGSKKLLLVLDDLWSDNEDFVAQWENFISCLSSCLSESRILLTTQSKNATQQVGLASVTEVEAYNLKEIEDDQFSELFMHYAWPSNSHLQKEEFEKIGGKIAVKLKGDPGAAKLVGHQLREKLDLRYWEEVAEKDWLGDNMKARIWSYQQLSLEIQRCFAICSLFPKGKLFSRPFLIDFWMAEGFIRPIDKQERLEDIGENYLHELVSRFFMEQVVVDEIIYYQLHDLFHDLAERVQGDDFIRIDSTNSREVLSHMLCRNESIRHIYLPSSMISEIKENLCLMNNICTFLVKPDVVVPNKVLQEIFKKLEKLRVLDLPQCGDDLPDSIGNLKHLRYLNFGGFRPLKKLPDSICKLYHLQTLALPNCESLPKNFSELLSLRRFVTDGDTVSHISNVGRLTSLQGLEQFIVRKESGNELYQLENLNQLRGGMRIRGLENVGSTEDAIKANMQNKNHLVALEFEWNSDKRDTDNATGLSTQHVQLLNALQPHPNISVLTLKGFGGDRFPNWLLSQNSLNHLTSLTLENCNEVEEISSIEQSLPNCKSLILRVLKHLKKLPSLPPNLTYFEIDFLPQLSYFSEDDLLMKEQRKQSKLEDMKKVAECLKRGDVLFSNNFESHVQLFVSFLLHRFVDAIGDYPGPLLDEWVEKILTFYPWNKDYSRGQLVDVWVVLMHCDMETMFYKIGESKLVLPSSLTYLEISSCSITDDALSTCIQCLVSLSKLELYNIQTITSLPPKEVLCSLKNIQSLTITECYLLSSLGGIGALTSLTELELIGCLNLSTSNEPLPSSLERLKFVGCSNVDVIVAESNLPALLALYVSRITFKNGSGVLPVGHLPRLEKLSIIGCDGLLEGLNSLTTLYWLHVVNCPGINPSSPMDKYASALQAVSVDNPLLLKLILSNETMSSLESLLIIGFQGDSLDDDEVFRSLTSLKELGFYENNITHLPKNLKDLSSLQYMELENCPNLCELEELPRNLRTLDIDNCPTLTEKFNNKGGPYLVEFDKGSTIVKFPTEDYAGSTEKRKVIANLLFHSIMGPFNLQFYPNQGPARNDQRSGKKRRHRRRRSPIDSSSSFSNSYSASSSDSEHEALNRAKKHKKHQRSKKEKERDKTVQTYVNWKNYPGIFVS